MASKITAPHYKYEKKEGDSAQGQKQACSIPTLTQAVCPILLESLMHMTLRGLLHSLLTILL